MMGRLWLAVAFAICVTIAGCGGGDDAAEKKGKAVAAKAKPKARPKPKKKEEKKEEKPDPGFTDALTTLLPESLTVALGAQTDGLQEILDATGNDFKAGLHPAAMILARCGLPLENVEELWLGSNPQTNDSAICVKMKMPYDLAIMRAGLQIGEPLGAIDGKEIHALPIYGDIENAISLVDDKIFVLGRRKTVEEAMKRPTGGPLRKALEVSKTENAGYWVAGDSESYLQLLAHHGFSEFAAQASRFSDPISFALTIPTKAMKAKPKAKPSRGGRRGFGRGDDEEEDLPTVSASKTPAAKPITIAMGFAFQSERDALLMERRARSILDEMKAKLQAEASLQLTLSETEDKKSPPSRTGSQGAGVGTGKSPRFGRGRNDDDDGREPGRKRNNPKRDLLRESGTNIWDLNSEWSEPTSGHSFPLQRGDDEDDDRFSRRAKRSRTNRRGDDDDDEPRGRIGAPRGGLRPGSPITNARINTISPLNFRATRVTFNQTITSEGTNLRIELVMDLPPEMTSIVASVMRAAGNSLTGDGIVTGTLPAIVGSLEFWRNDQQANIRGVRKLPNLPIIAGYSWMTELLPFINQQDVYLGFDFDQDWMSNAENHRLAGTVIPEFLNPAAENAKWQGYPFSGMGLTHFVGMSGVEDGPNVVAAALDRSDPRAGIFGYDSIAKPDQITDGASQTIMLIGAGKLAGPWVQGGGATIRGAREPYFDELSGFGSAGLAQRGAYVLFADGSSRMISADIDPALFRAMCTIHGSEEVDLTQLEVGEKDPSLVAEPNAAKENP